MGQSDTGAAQTAAREQLLETARVLLKDGDGKFSIAMLCAKAGVERAVFRNHFAGKAALIAALTPVAAADEPAPSAPAAQSIPPQPIPKAESEPSVPTPDAWLERRLRVFERALNALEVKADAAARDQARAIQALEERLAELSPATVRRVPAPRPEVVPKPEPVVALDTAPQTVVLAEETQTEVCEPQPAKPELVAVTPPAVVGLSREEMADVLQKGRETARAAAAAAAVAQKPKRSKNRRIRWLAIGALSLVALFLCIGLTLGNTVGAALAWQGSATSYRHAVPSGVSRTIALADFGEPRAQAQLALAYLRGQGVARDPMAALRWSVAAAKSGQPVAQYLLGALLEQGAVTRPDPAHAFAWFAAAANKGNLKAMHNLAIAYAQGLGTQKNPALAAQWFTAAAARGYTDSAFDLAVLYERGDGVPQDLAQALKWYAIAAKAGDVPSRQRAETLREQMGTDAARLAANAAQDFTPLPALESANAL